MLNIIKLSDLAPKVLAADNNEIIGDSDSNKANEIVKIVSKSRKS